MPQSFPCLALALALSALAGCATADTSGGAIYEQGIKEAQAGNIDAAIGTLKRGATTYPDNPRIRLELARLQLEKGEPFHLQECNLRRQQADQLESSQPQEAQQSQREANAMRTRALPWYQAARENLEVVISLEEEPEMLAWASELAMKAAVFFEDWRAAYDHLKRAIEKGKPSGQRLSDWRNYQAALREKIGPDY
ncbi:MAG: tetratricopeptide repeat protein [Planctomycetota bacterium]